jgi:hypothetical protein
MRYILLLFSLIGFSQGVEFIPSNTVTAASLGIVYNDSNVDNTATMIAIIENSQSSAYNGVIWESNQTVHLDGTITINTTVDAGLAFLPSGSGYTTFITASGEGRMLHNVLGNVFRNFTIKNQTWIDNSTSSVQPENSASIWSFDFDVSNHYFENIEMTAPNAEIDGISYFSNDTGRVRDLTFINMYMHDIGRFGIEIFGERPPSFSGYDPTTDAFVQNILINNSRFERTGTIDHLGLSIVQTVNNVQILNTTFVDCVTALEIGASNVVIRNVDITGNDNGFWFGGVYDNFSTVIQEQTNYDITNLTMNVSGRPHMIMGVDDVVFNNCNLKWTGGSWWNQFATNIDLIDSTLEFGSNQGFAIEMLNNTGVWDWSNSILTNTSSDPIFESPSAINLTCVEIYLINGETFTGSDANTITDTSVYINDVFDSEIGDTGNDCTIIGYVEPSGATTTTGLQMILSIIFD